MSRENQTTRSMVPVVLAMAVLAFSAATAKAQEPNSEQRLTLTAPASELQIPDEPKRRYGWPIAMMSASTLMTAAGMLVGYANAFDHGCGSPSCSSSGLDAGLLVPLLLGPALLAIGVGWLIASVRRFRRERRAFEEGSRRLAW